MKTFSFGSGLIVVCVPHNKTHPTVPSKEIKLFFVIHEYVMTLFIFKITSSLFVFTVAKCEKTILLVPFLARALYIS